MTAQARTTAEQINLDGRAFLRLKHGPHLLGHYPSVDALIQALPGVGVQLTDIEIVKGAS